MKQHLQKRISGEILTKTEAQEVLSFIGRGEANNSQIASLLTTYMINPITVDELEGFRDENSDKSMVKAKSNIASRKPSNSSTVMEFII